ncbi:DUF2982 domain-containing protein [Planctobacterium marinum]|uniref:DUF2982 domain-containing protein n=1 Tax=Planctobacterium marinum TaxID=1631968 RepID=UPI001E2A7609|nr:DUF2982 domain-containing protein [Planctobacterium marinum]MCC2607668.1 DUF2982 domain-containing protein [Planctobacterium marinum]
MTEIKHDIDDNQPIQIRATAKRNGLSSLIFGLLLLMIAILMFKVLPENVTLVAIFVTSAGIVALLLGLLKLREPQHSLTISKTQIDYQHRNGRWSLSWENVQRIDIPKVSSGLEQRSLSLVGLRVKHYGPILESISPRLMTHLLMEQRPLLLQNNADCASGSCYGDDLLEDDIYKDSDGKIYKGVQGMFANRMAKLRERLGYDLFINSAELDRSVEEFADLLRACHRSLLS